MRSKAAATFTLWSPLNRLIAPQPIRLAWAKMIKPIKLLLRLGLVLLGIGAVSASVAAQTAPPPSGPPSAADQPASNPVCVRYEAQLAALNRGATDPARADQTRRYEDS